MHKHIDYTRGTPCVFAQDCLVENINVMNESITTIVYFTRAPCSCIDNTILYARPNLDYVSDAYNNYEFSY